VSCFDVASNGNVHPWSFALPFIICITGYIFSTSVVTVCQPAQHV